MDLAISGKTLGSQEIEKDRWTTSPRILTTPYYSLLLLTAFFCRELGESKQSRQWLLTVASGQSHDFLDSLFVLFSAFLGFECFGCQGGPGPPPWRRPLWGLHLCSRHEALAAGQRPLRQPGPEATGRASDSGKRVNQPCRVRAFYWNKWEGLAGARTVARF